MNEHQDNLGPTCEDCYEVGVIRNDDSPRLVHLCERHAATWQPIETAPKMRTVILWADTSTPEMENWHMGSGVFDSGMNVWIWEGEQVRSWVFPPTHWMPLPAPPLGEKQ